MFNLRIVKEYLRHRFKAKTRHGLHSPFVYKLVDEVVYDFGGKKVYTEIETLQNADNPRPRVKKVNRLLYRIVADREPKNVLFLGKAGAITEAYIKAASPAFIGHDISELTYLDTAIIDTKDNFEASSHFNSCLEKADEDTLIILKNIHSTKMMTTVWEEIKANPQVAITVDLFFIGLIYFRKGQVREDFWIRF